MNIKKILACMVLFSAGCVPTYQSRRAHIPLQMKEGELQLDAEIPVHTLVGDKILARADGSYALTNHFLLQLGGVYSYEEIARGEDGALIKDRLRGFHLGVGSLLKLNDWIRLSTLAGVAVQRWSYEVEDIPKMELDDLDVDVSQGFDRFEAAITSPFVQGALTFFGARSNLSLGLRVERAGFQFSEASPLKRDGIVHNLEEQAILVSPVFQANLGIFESWSLYYQFLLTMTFNVDDSTGILFDPWDQSIGLIYLWGGGD